MSLCSSLLVHPEECPEPNTEEESILYAPAPDSDRLVHRLDLRAYRGPVNTVMLNGSLWGWDPAQGIFGEDPDGDGIYTLAFAGIPGMSFACTYRVNGMIEDLTVAGECVGNALTYDAANRIWSIGDPNPVDIFGGCERCR